MKIAIGSDHIGYAMKGEILAHLRERGFDVFDVGPQSLERCDYPVYAQRVALRVAQKQADLGVLICGTGVGISIAANKTPGIRAVVCSETYSARMARQHNNANIVAFGARVVGSAVAEEIVDAFLEAGFEGGRHQKRLNMLEQIERGEILS